MFIENLYVYFLFVVERGCLEILENQNSNLLFTGGSYGQDIIFTNKCRKGIFAKALDDSLIFIISRGMVVDFFKEIIEKEYQRSSKKINDIMFFSNSKEEDFFFFLIIKNFLIYYLINFHFIEKFSNKERMKLSSTLKNIFVETKESDQKQNPLLFTTNSPLFLAKNVEDKSKSEVLLENIVKKHVQEIKFNYQLKKNLTVHHLFSNFTSDQLNSLIAGMKIHNYFKEDIIYDSDNEEGAKIFILIEGKIKYVRT